MEQWGTGVQRVYDQIAAAGLPEPRVEEVMDRLRFTVYVPSHAPDASLGSDTKHQDMSASEQVSNLGEQATLLLTLAAESPRSRAELLQALNLTDAYGNYRRHLIPLIEGGYLARTIPDKSRSQHQRYIATPEGRRRLSETSE